MKNMKGYIWLGMGAFFFILALITLASMPPSVDATKGISAPTPILTIGLVGVTVILFGLTIMCLSNYWFGYLMQTTIVGIIPERMASSRFPGKPLAKINGQPMVWHVWKAAKENKTLDEVYICSPDMEVLDCMKSSGAKTIHTSIHNRASDQVAEAVKILNNTYKINPDAIVMIQGDEPMITPEMIDAALQPLFDGKAEVSNLMARIETDKEAKSRNTIKVVTDINSNALYFSRQPIPDGNVFLYRKQVCIIPFTKSTLSKFTSLPQTPLEQAESVDMMRLVENGIKVKMVLTETKTHAVDVPADIKIVEKMMKCRKSS